MSRKQPRGARPPGKPTDVGYGRPPVTHQFKPGQSGNPRGRPKGTKNEATMLHEVLNRRIEVRQNGMLRRVTVLEALLLRSVEDGLKGNPKAAAFLLNRHAMAERGNPDPQTSDEEDKHVIESFARKVEAEFKSKEELK
jgi:hypothetical protein